MMQQIMVDLRPEMGMNLQAQGGLCNNCVDASGICHITIQPIIVQWLKLELHR